MRRQLALALLATLTLIVAPSSAAAQSGSGFSRVYVAVDGTWRAVYDPFSEAISYQEFAETTTLSAQYSVRRKPTYSVSAAVRIWRALGAGVSVTDVQSTTHADIEADVPHPFFFDQPRHISGSDDTSARRETAIHLQARVFIPIRSRLDVTLFGGPSRWRVQQELLEGVDYTQQYPYDTARFAGARTKAATVEAWGYNGGVDVAAYVTRHIGVGALIEITTATLPLSITGGESFDANVGGVRGGAGLRVRF
jgi:hypothetical protein